MKMWIRVDKVNNVIIATKNIKSYTPIHTVNNEVGEKKNYNSNIYRGLKLWITLFFILFSKWNMMSAQNSFLLEQLKFDRVKSAYDEKYEKLSGEFKKKQLTFPPNNILIRSFKSEMELEVWVKEGGTYELFKTYKVCETSGELGPKLKQGDKQIPEGFYYIDRFNYLSKFYLSLGINYPNDADLIRSGGDNPGGDIFIHGDCVTVGCLPMTDDLIKEIYLLAVLAKDNGQSKIPVHIFPYKFTLLNNTIYKSFGKYLLFWNSLEEEYQYFEEYKKIRGVGVNDKGKYIFN